MAARDRYKINIKCEQCNLEGEAFLSELDYPFMSSRDLEVDKIDDNFHAEVVDQTRDQPGVLLPTTLLINPAQVTLT